MGSFFIDSQLPFGSISRSEILRETKGPQVAQFIGRNGEWNSAFR